MGFFDLEKTPLPEGWSLCRLPEFTDIVMGQSPSSETYNQTGVGLPFFQGKTEFGSVYPTIAKYCSSPNKVAWPGATLLSVRAPVGPTNLAREKSCIGRGLAAIHPLGGISPTFLLYLFRSIEADLAKQGTGSTFAAISKAFVEELVFFLPPLAEQHRIVAKIEELFSELDQGVASLKTAREQLKVYHQSLLKNAFEGKLTAAWRAAHADQLETATALQQRIARERQVRYQQQLTDWQTAGQPGPKPKPPKPLPPLTAEDLAELPELPKGWGWSSVSQLLAEGLCNGKSVKDRKGGFPVLRLNALGDGKIDLSVWKEGAWTATEAKAYIVEVGDFLVSRGNGSKHLVGRGGLVPALNGALVAFPDTMIRIRLLSQLVDIRYFGLCWDSTLVRSQIENSARTTAGIYKINQELIEAYKIPLPTALEEQQLIVQELESKLSEADQLELTLATALQQADALRQSILKKAFCGQLVKQDQNDEPASALLERIRTARSANQPARRGHSAGSQS